MVVPIKAILITYFFSWCYYQVCIKMQGLSRSCFSNTVFDLITAHIPIRRKCTVKQFHSLQITASVLFIYFFIKAYVVGTHLNCINKLMQFKWVPTTYAFIKQIRKKKTHPKKTSYKHNLISHLLIFFFLKCTLITSRYIFCQNFSQYFFLKI